jgi:hypothetical protein
MIVHGPHEQHPKLFMLEAARKPRKTSGLTATVHACTPLSLEGREQRREREREERARPNCSRCSSVPYGHAVRLVHAVHAVHGFRGEVLP